VNQNQINPAKESSVVCNMLQADAKQPISVPDSQLSDKPHPVN
jgi:hypothetical protein